MEEKEAAKQSTAQTPNAQTALVNKVLAQRVKSLRRNPRLCYAAGERAKRMGWNRLSPYGKELSDHFFVAGWDGKAFKEAAEEWNKLCDPQTESTQAFGVKIPNE